MHKIAVGGPGQVWGLDQLDLIYKWHGSNWDKVIGALSSIAVSKDGDVWGIAPNGGVYRNYA